MSVNAPVYKSAENKTEQLANDYLQTHQAPHRYLAYKDIPNFIHQFVQGRQVLDFGSGTGASCEFLYNLGLDVVGVDVSSSMLETARSNLPSIKFYHVKDISPAADFDFVFSSFVLLELSTKEEIIEYLTQVGSFLKEDGIFIAVTGSEELYSLSRDWMTFNVNFQENHNLKPGNIVKVALKTPEMEFYDYFWREVDYLECFKKTHLEILQIHYPLGTSETPYPWKDERSYSPFTIFIAKKNSSLLID